MRHLRFGLSIFWVKCERLFGYFRECLVCTVADNNIFLRMNKENNAYQNVLSTVSVAHSSKIQTISKSSQSP